MEVLGLIPKSCFWKSWDLSQTLVLEQVGTYPKLSFLEVLGLTLNNQQLLNLLSQNCFFDSSGTCPKIPECTVLGFVPKLELKRFGNYPSYHICKTLGLIPKSCFSLLWAQSQLKPVHDIGTDPKTLFFITLGSIPTMDCT